MAALATMALGLLARGDVGDDGEFTLPFDDQIKCSQVVEGPRSVCEPQNNTFEGSTHSRRTTDEARNGSHDLEVALRKGSILHRVGPTGISRQSAGEFHQNWLRVDLRHRFTDLLASRDRHFAAI